MDYDNDKMETKQGMSVMTVAVSTSLKFRKGILRTILSTSGDEGEIPTT
jgi:hypothetical protein